MCSPHPPVCRPPLRAPEPGGAVPPVRAGRQQARPGLAGGGGGHHPGRHGCVRPLGHGRLHRHGELALNRWQPAASPGGPPHAMTLCSRMLHRAEGRLAGARPLTATGAHPPPCACLPAGLLLGEPDAGGGSGLASVHAPLRVHGAVRGRQGVQLAAVPLHRLGCRCAGPRVDLRRPVTCPHCPAAQVQEARGPGLLPAAADHVCQQDHEPRKAGLALLVRRRQVGEG